MNIYKYIKINTYLLWKRTISSSEQQSRCCNIWTNCSKIWTVTSTSAIALWARIFCIPKCWHNISRRLLGNSGNNLFASFLVQIASLRNICPTSVCPWCERNQTSNVLLCATKGSSPKKSKKSPNAYFITGALATIALLIPVSLSIIAGMWRSGFTKVWKRSISFSPSHLTAAISVIPCLFLLNPVVSKSHIT